MKTLNRAMLVASAALCFNISAYSQDITLRIKDLPVKEAMEKVKSEAGYSFIFQTNDLNVAKRVSIDANKVSIDEIVKQILNGQEGVTYEIKGKNVILSKSPKKSQRKHIKGHIFDSKGEAIIGATIMEIGTSNGTITDIDGNFFLEVAPTSKLKISYIGYKDRILILNNKSQYNIKLVEDTKALDEVVVVGYGMQKKVNLTGSVTSVKAETLDNMSTNNLSNALAGRAPGVNVTNTSGFAGASSSIRIRGSFGEPLYVINNVIKDKADFDALDPNEVESISFLKDAASASIYGSKAGNGVVLVTTRGGNKDQKPVFQYKGSYSVSKTTRDMIDFSAQDEIIWANRVQQFHGRPDKYGPEILDYFKDKSYNVNDYVWRNPSAWQHNLSVNGGNDRLQYFLLLGYQDQKGSYKNLGYKRYNFRSDITANITKRFKVNVNLSGNQRNYQRFYWFDNVEDFNVPDFYRTTFNWTRLYPFYVDDQGNPTDDVNANPVVAGSWHPVDMVLGDRYQKQVKRTFDGQIRLSLDLGDFVKGLKTSVLAQYTGYDQNHKAYITHNVSYKFQSASTENPFIPGPVDPNQLNIHNMGTNFERIKEAVKFNSSYQFNWFINYNRKFGKHDVSGMLIYEQAEREGKNLNGHAEDLMTNIDQIFATSSDTSHRYFDGNEWEDARQSVIGRFNYNYNNKYIAEFSFREDGNYKFAPGKRWGFFPSGSVAWRISEENFMKKFNWLSNLKFRASYGSTGDDSGLGAFLWRNAYHNANGFMYGTELMNGLALGSTPNENMTWAKMEVIDAGFDFGFFNNRLTGEFDYYYKRRSDILGTRIASVPGVYGASLAPENYAEQEWNGIEVATRWSDHKDDLFYSLYANLGYVKDKWVKWDEPIGLEEWRSRIGRPNNRIMGYISEGMIRTQEQLDAIPEDFTQFGRKPMLGTLLFRDIRGSNYSEGPDGKIDKNDMTYISDNGVPRINYGFGFNLEWKGLAVDAHFQGVGAYDRMVATKNGQGVFQVGTSPYFDIWAGDNPWCPENPNAKYPRVTGNWMQPEFGGGASTFWLRNGAYMRLKNLNIAYTLPKRWTSHVGINRLQIFLNGTNLFCISGMDEYDPEQSTLDSYPLMRTYTAGLSINF